MYIMEMIYWGVLLYNTVSDHLVTREEKKVRELSIKVFDTEKTEEFNFDLTKVVCPINFLSLVTRRSDTVLYMCTPDPDGPRSDHI